MALKSILPLTPNITLIDDNKVFDKRDAQIKDINDISILNEIRNFFANNYKTVKNISSKSQVVSDVENKVIEFYHKTSNGIIEPKNGFLVEVYASR